MLIDLGEEWDRPAEPEGPSWMVGWRPIVATLALLPVLALTAATPVPAPALTLLADLGLGPSEELIEFSGNETIVRDGRVVTVYERDGRERWHSTLSSVNDVFFRVDVDRGRVLAMAQRMQVPRTVAFDLATGARVWEFDGWADTLDDLVFVASLEGEDFAVYDARTLKERWCARGLLAHSLDTESRTLVSLDKAGRIVEYSLATGVVVRSGQIDLPKGLNYGINAVDDTISLFFSRSTDYEHNMINYDRHSYAVLTDQTPRFSRSARFDCGPVVCEQDIDGDQVSIVDALTGAKLWRASFGASVMSTPAGLFSFPRFESADSPPLELLDPLTGRRLASLEGWQPIPVEGVNRAAPVVLRAAHTAGADGQTFIAGFDRNGLRVLGSVNHVIYHCRYADWALACVTGDRRLLILEINSGRWRM